jgi:hypothetical protein
VAAWGPDIVLQFMHEQNRPYNVQVRAAVAATPSAWTVTASLVCLPTQTLTARDLLVLSTPRLLRGSINPDRFFGTAARAPYRM